MIFFFIYIFNHPFNPDIYTFRDLTKMFNEIIAQQKSMTTASGVTNDSSSGVTTDSAPGVSTTSAPGVSITSGKEGLKKYLKYKNKYLQLKRSNKFMI